MEGTLVSEVISPVHCCWQLATEALSWACWEIPMALHQRCFESQTNISAAASCDRRQFPTCLHTCLQTCLQTCPHSCPHTCPHTCVHTCLHACLRICPHTCLYPPCVIAGMLRLLRVVFLPVLLNNMQALQCNSYATALFLRAAPQIDCWTTEHWKMVGFGSTSLILFNCGVPLTYAAIILHGSRNKLLSKAKFVQTFGFIFMALEPKWVLWPVKVRSIVFFESAMAKCRPVCT